MFLTVQESRAEIEALFLTNVLAGLSFPSVMSKDKAVEIAGRVLGLEKGVDNGDIGPNTAGVLHDMALALSQAATERKAAPVEGNGVSTEPSSDPFPFLDREDTDPGGR